MDRQRIVVVGVLACVVLAAFVAPAAAKPHWKKAPCTIVGTGQGEMLRGTGVHDVICARGGNDTCTRSAATTSSAVGRGTTAFRETMATMSWREGPARIGTTEGTTERPDDRRQGQGQLQRRGRE